MYHNRGVEMPRYLIVELGRSKTPLRIPLCSHVRATTSYYVAVRPFLEPSTFFSLSENPHVKKLVQCVTRPTIL